MYVLDGRIHHGTGPRIDAHYKENDCAWDAVLVLCVMLGFRFCRPRHDLSDRKPKQGQHHQQAFGGILSLVRSLQPGPVLPSAMLKSMATYQRLNRGWGRMAALPAFLTRSQRAFSA